MDTIEINGETYRRVDTSAERPYVVVCGHGGRTVLYGYAIDPAAGAPITLRRARMVIRWDAKCGAITGFAESGPVADTRLSKTVAEVHDACAQSLMPVSPKTAAKIEAWPVYGV